MKKLMFALAAALPLFAFADTNTVSRADAKTTKQFFKEYKERNSNERIVKTLHNTDLILDELKELRYEVLLLKNELIAANVITNTGKAAVITFDEVFRRRK